MQRATRSASSPHGGTGAHTDPADYPPAPTPRQSTRVRVRPGEWFNLGGTMAGSDEVSRAILQSGSGSASTSSVLMIRVE